MRISEIQVVTCRTEDRYPSEMNVETVLVCQSVASGTELARTETQEEVPAGLLKRRMGSNLSKIAATCCYWVSDVLRRRLTLLLLARQWLSVSTIGKLLS